MGDFSRLPCIRAGLALTLALLVQRLAEVATRIGATIGARGDDEATAASDMKSVPKLRDVKRPASKRGKNLGCHSWVGSWPGKSDPIPHQNYE